MSDDRDYSHSNGGLLFPADNKTKPTDRDYRGSIDIDCPICFERTSWWLSGWKKIGRKGPSLSLSLKAKEAADTQPGPKSPDGDDIPF